MNEKLSRRKLIVTGLAAAAGLSGLAVATRLAGRYGLVPPDCRGLYGTGATLTYAAHRMLTRHSLAREFPRNMISGAPFANGKPPELAADKTLQAGGFADWRLQIDGMVAHPGSFSISDLKGLPRKTKSLRLLVKRAGAISRNGLAPRCHTSSTLPGCCPRPNSSFITQSISSGTAST